MKTNKLFLVAALLVLTLFTAVSCTEYSVLDSLLKATSNIDNVTNSYDSETIDDNVQVLAFSETEYEVKKLAESTSDLVIFNELRLELINLHEQILEQRYLLVNGRDSIRSSVETIKTNQYIVLDGDKTIITEHIQNLKLYRDGLLETKGLAYLRIHELKGTYTRENLPDIIIVFEEVIEILEYRLDTLKLAVFDLDIIDVLLLDYLEN